MVQNFISFEYNITLMNTPSILAQTFTLPCGTIVPNRIIKSAMSEYAVKNGTPNQVIVNMYERWGKGGAGILISGNVMVDSRTMEEFRNIVVEDDTHLEILKEIGHVSQKHGTHLWMQINHPGRQARGGRKSDVVSPSDVLLPIMKGVFAKPRPLKEVEIKDLIQRYANTAEVAKKAGWKGVQIHGAHGYLVSQFLSTRTNKRKDDWGGSLENRARFVREIYKEMRSRLGNDFPIGIKINSKDFQKGAFTEDESMQVIQWLAEDGIDMIEISGGTYERAAMVGIGQKESTKRREAYFADFVNRLRTHTNVPLLLTGGLRTAAVMETALQNNEFDFVGMARPFAVDPDIARHLIDGTVTTIQAGRISSGISFVDKLGILDVHWYADQMKRMGRGLEPDPKLGNMGVLFRTLKSIKIMKK